MSELRCKCGWSGEREDLDRIAIDNGNDHVRACPKCRWVSEEMMPMQEQQCPGCGVDRRAEYSHQELHVAHAPGCPWLAAWQVLPDSATGQVSWRHADARWREHWHPKVGDWVTAIEKWGVHEPGSLSDVAECQVETFGNWGRAFRPAFASEIEAAKQAPARNGMDASAKSDIGNPAGPGLRIEVGKSYRTRGGYRMDVEESKCRNGRTHLFHLPSERGYGRWSCGRAPFTGQPSSPDLQPVAPWPSAADIPAGYEDSGEFRVPKPDEIALGQNEGGFCEPFYVPSSWPKGEKRHILRKLGAEAGEVQKPDTGRVISAASQSEAVPAPALASARPLTFFEWAKADTLAREQRQRAHEAAAEEARKRYQEKYVPVFHSPDRTRVNDINTVLAERQKHSGKASEIRDLKRRLAELERK